MLAVGFAYGFAASQFSLFPYQYIRGAYRVIRSVQSDTSDMQDENAATHEPGTLWRPVRSAAPSPDLTEDQRAAIDRLRSIGYLPGSQPGPAGDGVTLHDRERSHAGLNLWMDGHAAEAVLMDMEGRELHRWSLPIDSAFGGQLPVEPADTLPFQAFWRRVKLLDNGDLLVIYEGQGLVRINSESRVLWACPCYAHHDFEVLDDGSIYVLTREAALLPRINTEEPILHDFVTLLDSDGREQARVSLLEAIERSDYTDLLTRLRRSGDVMHTNTLEVLDGSLEERLPAFRKGNILLSIREINTLAVLDFEAEEIVWALSGPWVAQHQPTVLTNGNILLFDNLGAGGQRSRVIEIDPLTQRLVWTYDGREHGLLSTELGSSQRLPNGNTLITESDNGRAIEVTPTHETVWEFRTPNRAGPNGEWIAALVEVERIDSDLSTDWARKPISSRGASPD